MRKFLKSYNTEPESRWWTKGSKFQWNHSAVLSVYRCTHALLKLMFYCFLFLKGWKTTTPTIPSTTSTQTTAEPITSAIPKEFSADDENIVGRESSNIEPKQYKSKADNDQVLTTQHATIALISTVLFITLVLIIVFVSCRTKFHQKIKKYAVTDLQRENTKSQGKKYFVDKIKV